MLPASDRFPSSGCRVSGPHMDPTSKHRRLPTPSVARIALLCSGLAWGCPKKSPIQQKPEVDPSTLFLEPVPTMTATLSITGPDRIWSGPTRIETNLKATPLRIDLEDFDLAEPVEICVESTDPTKFCEALDAMKDTGALRRTDKRLEIDLQRQGYDEQIRDYKLRVNLAPTATPSPEDWLESGTVLYFGRAFDSNPATKTVPMALNVRLGSASDGGRVFTWTADIDKRAEKEVTSDTQRSGRRLISAEVVESAAQHSDAFLKPESMGDDTGSLFLSRKTLADAIRYGGSAFHDKELSAEGVLVVTGQTNVVVQVDDGLWSIPAVVAVVNGGEGVYVVANDPDNPLILSATRPGYQIRLMAIGTPSEP